MRYLRLLILSLVILHASAAWAVDPPPAAPGGPAQEEEQVPVRIWLSQTPIARVICKLNNETTGRHIDVVWDPNQSGSLTRFVLLGKKGTWRASFATESLGMAADLHQDHLVRYKVEFSTKKSQCPPSSDPQKSCPESVELELEGCELSANLSLLDLFQAQPGSTNSTSSLPNLGKSVVTAQLRCEGKTEQTGMTLEEAAESLHINPTAVGLGARSMADGISKVAGDVFQILAEIAFERAKAKSFEILTSRIIDATCRDLTWDVALFGNSQKLGLGAAKKTLLLPNTCQMVKDLRLQELTAASKALYQAFLTDLTEISLEASLVTVENLATQAAQDKNAASLQSMMRGLITAMKPIIKDLAQGKARPSEQQAQMILVALREAVFKPVAEEPLALCSARLGLAVLGFCNKKSGCNAREITTLLRSPEKLFKLDRCQQALVPDVASATEETKAAFEELRSQLAAFVSRGQEMLFPPAGATGATVLRGGIGLALDVLEGLCSAEAGCRALGAVPPLRKLITGILDGDIQLVIVGLTTLIENRLQAVARLAQEQFSSDDFSYRSIGQKLLDVPTDPAKLVEEYRSSCSFAVPERGADCKLAKHIGIAAGPFKSQWIQDRQDKLKQTLTQLEQAMVSVSTAAAMQAGAERDAAKLAALSKQDKLAAEATAIMSQLHSIRAYQGTGKKVLSAFQRVSLIIGAVTAYSASYPGAKDDPKLAQAQHDARKKAIESLIEASTQRDKRDGDWVVSLGANVGFFGGYQYMAQRIELGAMDPRRNELGVYPNLTLPMGLAIQLLPNRNARSLCLDAPSQMLCRRRVSVGLHMQASFIDLAQFLSIGDTSQITEAQWANFFMLGGQIGMIIGTPTLPFVLALDGRWSPTLFKETFDTSDPNNRTCPEGRPGCSVGLESRQGVYRIGAVLSFYVPFFDFN